MKINVLFLGVLKYTDKKTQEPRVRITYVVNDVNSKQDTVYFKGLNECVYFTDKAEIFDKFTKEDALTNMEFVLENKPSLTNPLKTITRITEIRTKRDNIKLV